MTADQFAADMLAELRKEFFSQATEKQFHQEKHLLLQAIAAPARYLNERGANASASKYRAIIRTVIRVIKEKGNRAKIHRFSVYFLHCVQAHMQHQGDEYYQSAKASRPIASLLDPAIRKLQQTEASRTTEVLAETHRTLAGRGRRKNAKTMAFESDLFDHCKGRASALQKEG